MNPTNLRKLMQKTEGKKTAGRDKRYKTNRIKQKQGIKKRKTKTRQNKIKRKTKQSTSRMISRFTSRHQVQIVSKIVHCTLQELLYDAAADNLNKPAARPDSEVSRSPSNFHSSATSEELLGKSATFLVLGFSDLTSRWLSANLSLPLEDGVLSIHHRSAQSFMSTAPPTIESFCSGLRVGQPSLPR